MTPADSVHRIRHKWWPLKLHEMGGLSHFSDCHTDRNIEGWVGVEGARETSGGCQ